MLKNLNPDPVRAAVDARQRVVDAVVKYEEISPLYIAELVAAKTKLTEEVIRQKTGRNTISDPVRRAIAEREWAYAEVVRAHKRLALYVANSVAGENKEDKGLVSYQDLIGISAHQVFKVIDRFDPALGYRFTTYAYPSMMGACRAEWRKKGGIKIPKGQKDLQKRIAEETERLTQILHRQPTREEIQEAVGKEVDIDNIEKTQRASQVGSLEDSGEPDDSREGVEGIPSETELVDDQIIAEDEGQSIKLLITDIENNKTRSVMWLYWIEKKEPMTIARQLRMPIGTVKSHIFAGRTEIKWLYWRRRLWREPLYAPLCIERILPDITSDTWKLYVLEKMEIKKIKKQLRMKISECKVHLGVGAVQLGRIFEEVTQ